MTTSISRIQSLLSDGHDWTAKQMRDSLGVSQVLVHRHLKSLCESGKIKKIGSPPFVVYRQNTLSSSLLTSSCLAENWLEILPEGAFVYGNSGFEHWCATRGFDPIIKQKEYEEMYIEKSGWKQDGLIDATEKITKSFSDNFLEKLWYIDFYSWEIFGRTLLGKLVLYAKQNSDTVLMKKIADKITQPITHLLTTHHFSHIIAIPHSVPRKKDFLKTTLSYIPLSLAPEFLFQKVFADHAVAQKTLKSKQEREENAQKTMIYTSSKSLSGNILLIDDACGSGSTLNIAAKKIKVLFPEAKIFAIAFVGSIKGFDVIAES